MDLTDEQWAVIEPLIPQEKREDSGGFDPTLQVIADDLLEHRQLDLSECCIDGTIVPLTLAFVCAFVGLYAATRSRRP